jgi:hypothetical protein
MLKSRRFLPPTPPRGLIGARRWFVSRARRTIELVAAVGLFTSKLITRPISKRTTLMKTNRYMHLLLVFAFACLALPADAADRIRVGQWVGTTTVAGKTFTTSNCMAQSDVDAMNGDAKSVQAYLEKAIPPAICKLTDFKVNGGQVIYTSVCGGAAANVITTTYHGDSFESADTKGTKSEGKLTGACK